MVTYLVPFIFSKILHFLFTFQLLLQQIIRMCVLLHFCEKQANKFLHNKTKIT